jgi:D-serine deaminase-like pyridoxal phosphate-dependent protein
VNVLAGELALPVLVLKEVALANNLAVMAAYAREHGFVLAPHGKTTMAPALFKQQLAAGAWGMTVANMAQALVAFEAGASRVLVANELVSLADARAAARCLTLAGRELYCLSDSVEGVELLDANLAEAGAAGRLGVLVELGVPGGRTGARSEEAAVATAEAVQSSQRLRLAGVEGYEGILANDRSPEALAAVDAFLVGLRRLVVRLADAGAFSEGLQPVVSAGGSTYFDRVAELLGAKAKREGYFGDHDVLLVVRSGCYLVHAHGVYAHNSPLASGPGPTLLPALELWAEVVSVPEPGLAIVGLGKRDAPYDLGLPVPLGVVRGEQAISPLAGAKLRKLNDQHGYLTFNDGRGYFASSSHVSFL